jgi:hypothetical protein
MSYYLFLDDVRYPEDVTWVQLPKGIVWQIVRSYEEFVEQIQSAGIPKFIAFDHDLAYEHYSGDSTERTGWHCAQWLVNKLIDDGLTKDNVPDYIVHSMNPIGKKKIEEMMQDAQRFL